MADQPLLNEAIANARRQIGPERPALTVVRCSINLSLIAFGHKRRRRARHGFGAALAIA